MTVITDQHFKELSEMKVPVKRAAYSDRTAWTMAILAELAYERFDEESDDWLIKIARELASLVEDDGDIQKSTETIKLRLLELSATLAGLSGGRDENGNAILKAALKAGGFELAGGSPIHEPSTDTQAFVALRRAADGTGMAVICFRGTQQIRDWLTNISIATSPVMDPSREGGELGNFHKGFHEAYLSVHDQINQRLAGTESLPLYITGHSLGGALAVVATWYQSAQRLAACYTFGAPRVGDAGLMGRFKTPIYRIVNAADPVPLVPPPGWIINLGKFILRFLTNTLPFGGIFDRALNFLITVQDFRHYGDNKYLPFANPDAKGQYPNLRLQPGVSGIARLVRYFRVMITPKAVASADGTPAKKATAKRDRIDKYHDMSRYRDKLRAIAIRKNT